MDAISTHCYEMKKVFKNSIMEHA